MRRCSESFRKCMGLDDDLCRAGSPNRPMNRFAREANPTFVRNIDKIIKRKEEFEKAVGSF
jgi:hypothetical protein